jgi:hypothetical protein
MGILDALKIRQSKTKDKKLIRIRGRALFEAQHLVDADAWKNMSPVEKMETRQKIHDDIRAQIYNLFLDLAVEDLEKEVQGGVALSRKASQLFLVAPTTMSAEAYNIVTKYMLDNKKRDDRHTFRESLGEFKPKGR